MAKTGYKFAHLLGDCVHCFSGKLVILSWVYTLINVWQNSKFCSAIIVVMKCPRIFFPRTH